jgi:hypothetical protein
VNFRAEVHQNEYLPQGWSTVHAIATISSHESDGRADSAVDLVPEAVEVIILDCSSSMGPPSNKMQAAIAATQRAIGRIRDGTWFAVIAGTSHARVVYPQPEPGSPHGSFVPVLARASWSTRAGAKLAVKKLVPNGGTRMSTWLQLARQLFETQPGSIHHAILLADGQNEHDEGSALAREVERCVGKFQCDCRGVGTAWDRNELQSISDALLGTTDIIPHPAQMAAEFESIMTKAMSKRIGSVLLCALTPVGGQVTFMRQVSPELLDLTGKATWQQPVGPSGEWLSVDEIDPSRPLVSMYPVGSWGDRESREYHTCLSVIPQDTGADNEIRAARLSLVIDGRAVCTVPVRAIWTEDEERATRINRVVAHFTDQAELARSIEEGLEAKRTGDLDTATHKLGRAAQLAHETGNEGTRRLLERVVEIENPEAGTVRIRTATTKEDEMILDTRSRKTVRLGRLGG